MTSHVTGLRQTGKTTFLQHQFPSEARRFISFDDFAQLSAAKSDPDRFVNSDEPLTIDEAHKCPEIFTAIKRIVDRKRKPGQFLLKAYLRHHISLCFPIGDIFRHFETEPLLEE
jgi:predicted AAA+ superfamily ATPase